MSSVIIAGNTSGTITLDAPNVAGTTTLTLPATTGTFITTTGGVTPGTAGNVLQSNGTAWTSAAVSAGGLGGTTVFTSGGTFTIPTGKTVVKVTVVGGGGSTPNLTGGSVNVCSGGGGGGNAIKYLTGLTPGNTLTVTVAGTTSIGNSGSSSSVASGTQTITTISATGGAVGSRGTTCGAVIVGPVNGGAGSNGDINTNGGLGAASFGEFPSCGNPGATFIGFGGGTLLSQPIPGLMRYQINLYSSTAGSLYGGGANGYIVQAGQGAGNGGATGAAGIVIFEY